MMTKQKTGILLVVVLSFVVLLLNDYSKDSGEATRPQAAKEVKGGNVKEVLQNAITDFEGEQKAYVDSLVEAGDYKSLGLLLEQQGKLDASVVCYMQMVNNTSDKEVLLFIGRKIVNSLRYVSQPQVRQSGADVAKSVYEGLIEKDAERLDYKIGLAGCFIEGYQDVMTGVTLLKEVVSKDSLNIPANFILGRLSIQSMQYEKAIGRFNVVLQQSGETTDILLYISEAYSGLGQNDKALEYLKRARDVSPDPSIKERISKEIERIS